MLMARRRPATPAPSPLPSGAGSCWPQVRWADERLARLTLLSSHGLRLSQPLSAMHTNPSLTMCVLQVMTMRTLASRGALWALAHLAAMCAAASWHAIRPATSEVAWGLRWLAGHHHRRLLALLVTCRLSH